ncbi:MAG: hypothetical protein K6E29_08015, partial [Cyanobacteria bacterium RUI128]|nr:hypothetical protein [Cyanobacteria bacterium RUI128]
MQIQRCIKTEEIEKIPVFSDTVFKISLLKHLEFIKRLNLSSETSCHIEFGSVARTIDLQKYGIYEIAKIIKDFCTNNNFGFYYETPVIIKKNDTERVFEDIKKIVSDIKPDALVINNYDLLARTAADREINFPEIHLGTSICHKDISKYCKEYPQMNITG